MFHEPAALSGYSGATIALMMCSKSREKQQGQRSLGDTTRLTKTESSRLCPNVSSRVPQCPR